MATLRWLTVLSFLLTACSFQSETEAFYLDGSVHRVLVETVGGDVQLIGVPGTEIGVEAETTWVGPRPRVDAQLRGGILRVVSPCLNRGSEPCRVHLTIKVPNGVEGQVITKSGDLFLEGNLGPIAFQTQSGSLHQK